MEIKLGDDFDPQETSRIAVADCVAFSLASDLARNKAFVIGTKEGDGGPSEMERSGRHFFSSLYCNTNTNRIEETNNKTRF